MSGVTIWRVNGSIECHLVHRTTPSSICGAQDMFKATSGIGFGSNSSFFTSTLSVTANISLGGTLVECFGPANSVDPVNRVNSNTILVLGQCNVLISEKKKRIFFINPLFAIYASWCHLTDFVLSLDTIHFGNSFCASWKIGIMYT